MKFKCGPNEEERKHLLEIEAINDRALVERMMKETLRLVAKEDSARQVHLARELRTPVASVEVLF